MHLHRGSRKATTGGRPQKLIMQVKFCWANTDHIDRLFWMGQSYLSGSLLPKKLVDT